MRPVGLAKWALSKSPTSMAPAGSGTAGFPGVDVVPVALGVARDGAGDGVTDSVMIGPGVHCCDGPPQPDSRDKRMTPTTPTLRNRHSALMCASSVSLPFGARGLLRDCEEIGKAGGRGQNRDVSIRRALVLGSGGATGIAWELGVLTGLSRAGLALDAELVIGTSAGAVVAARLTTSDSLPGLEETRPERAGRLGAASLARLLGAQFHPSRRHALIWLGARAARAWTPSAEAAWVYLVAPGLAGRPWPDRLVIVATDAASGRPAFFSAAHPADLAATVAASCAVPGVFPAVRIDGRLHFDGGLRSPANLDIAGDADAVIAVAPLSGAVRAHRRAGHQAAQLRKAGARVVLIEPDLAGRVALGPDLLAPDRADRAFAAGLAAAERNAEAALGIW